MIPGKRNIIVIFVLILLIGNSQQISAQDKDSLAKNPPLFLEMASKFFEWNEPAEPIKIAGPIYYVGTKGLGSYLITSPDGHILLYTGTTSSGPLIEASIKKLGFNPKDIKLLLTGHAHSDHVGGHAYIKKISGAQVVMMEAEKELLESGGKTDFHYGEHQEFLFESVKVDRIIHDGETIKLGNIEMTALHTAGHTKGGTTWIINVTDNGKTYNVVFPDGTTINPGYRVAKEPSYPGIGDNYRNTLHTLEMLKPDIWLSSHTDFFNFERKRKRAVTEGVNAYIDPEGYRQRIIDERGRFEAEVNREMGIQVTNIDQSIK